ncbi:MAG: hypothetical protein HY918_03960 [Candidatus Doudnabacteria bacterium]|nr:hypothetical protein [Candidatus Doudnabacteria bacterium]
MPNRLNTLKHIDSLHTLSVWTPFGSLMTDLHCFLNGQRQPYGNGEIFMMSNVMPFTNEQVLESLGSRGKKTLPLWLDTRRSAYLRFNASVASALPLPGSDTAWILTLEGEVSCPRFEGVITTAKMVGFYDCKNGRGFILIPELALQQLYVNR